MRKILLVGFFLLLFQTFYSQYVPMPVDSATWRVSFSNPNIGLYGTLVYELNGDTLISGYDYSKVFERDNLFGFMREEEKLVYFKPNPDYDYLSFSCDSNEIILYDYNLELGDTFRLPSCSDFGIPDSLLFVFVLNVDSIQTNEGDYRKRYIFSDNIELPYGSCGAFQWVEGIGNIAHSPFYHHLDCFETGFSFECFKYSDEISYGDCNTDSNKKIEIADVNIFPNPASDKVLITGLNSYADYSISVFDSFGQHILNNNKNQSILDIRDFTSGLYFIVITIDNSVIVKKIIKL